MSVFEMIEEQQKGKERTAVWVVGEQLKDMCRREPACAAILEEDLQNKGMSLAAAEKKIKAYADSQRKNGFACVLPHEAEDILREFYGLPGRCPGETSAARPKGQILSLMDLME